MSPFAGKNLKPGVGYVAPPPQFSYAGGNHTQANPKWSTPVKINTSINIEGKSGWELDTALAQRYAGGDSNRRRAGAPGVHSSEIARYLREAFLSRSAWWKVDYEEYDGLPTITEIYDAYFGQKSDRGLGRYIAKRKGEGGKDRGNGGTKAPIDPPVTPPVLPPVVPVPASIYPLSHPSVRVEEIRSALLSSNALPEPWNGYVKILLSSSVWLLALKSISIDALIFLRKWRFNLGIDKRSLP